MSMNKVNTIVEVNNLSVSFDKDEVVKDVSFKISSGEFVGLAGPNGAGKTTLIRAILGLIPHSKGNISLFGERLDNFNDWHKIGYLQQKTGITNNLFPANVEEVLTLGLIANKKSPKIITKSDKIKVNEISEKFGIAGYKKQLFYTLSGGQQQTVMLARALVAQPKLLIFDEPSTALDPEARESFFSIISKLNMEENITIILITHDTGYIGRYASKLLYIDRKLIFYDDFKNFCQSKEMELFFGVHYQHLICHQHQHIT